ncbi:MAG: hypothetical protein ACO3SP_05590 [Ilumatobacteraceae bacterium]
MASGGSSSLHNWFSGRTRLVTVLSIIGVGLAGATAVGANIGILDSTSNGSVGEASLAGDLPSPSTQVVDVYLSDEGEEIQRFAVDVAGSAGLVATATGLTVDEVVPAAGWTWTLVQTSPMSLTITFTNGSRTLEFVASTTGDGVITTFVGEPAPTLFDDDHDDDDHDDDPDKKKDKVDDD